MADVAGGMYIRGMGKVQQTLECIGHLYYVKIFWLLVSKLHIFIVNIFIFK